MPGMSIYSASPGTGNKLGAAAVIQNQRDIADQTSLKSSAERIKKIRAQYSALPEEGRQATKGARTNAEKLVSVGVERAKQLRSMTGQAGVGKGGNVNSTA